MVVAQDVAIIPKPVKLQVTSAKDRFIIDQETTIIPETVDAMPAAEFLKDYLKKYYGKELTINPRHNSFNAILLKLDKVDSKVVGAYDFRSKKNNVQIKANEPSGLFYGVQSLIQLLPVSGRLEEGVASVSISDYPRFQYRGMHLDVSRHIFPVDYIKKYIDYLALHKMNVFHWHLTDDQGWRIEIKKHPKLTEVGAWRNGTIIGLFPGTGNDSLRYGGYYTQEEVKEVVRYAADRFITVLPEIDIPGHCMAVLATYPELSTTPNEPKQVAQTWGIYNRQNNVLVPSEKTFAFIEDVLNEVMDLFPSEYIHIGGDECAKKWWQESAVSQQFMKEHGLKDEKELQSYFIHQAEMIVNKKGRKIIGWNEILEGGLAPNAAVMSWQGIKGGITAAKQGHPVVMTPSSQMYFNHMQSAKEDSLTAAGKAITLDSVYLYDPVPAELTAKESSYIWGGQACLWTEYISNTAKVEYMLFPRLSALSEVLWSPKESRNWESFQKSLPSQFKRYDLWQANYSLEYFKARKLDPSTYGLQKARKS
ncbi:beta-N-acetylhexosaminidase [Flavisolibacter tropicus]|uniref:beta-N-acetylhexosaminidase n=2 Tax=Flavisolibacter tropicus TaxID=1492898 RepID=A0A172U2S5_9BACT|nr:beta-N-acetylhexosaminidase [Flavisolibacter tropicus]